MTNIMIVVAVMIASPIIALEMLKMPNAFIVISRIGAVSGKYIIATTVGSFGVLMAVLMKYSGMIISRCICGTQECGCSLCAHKERNSTGQRAKRCACLCERILAGCTPLSKLMGDLTAEAAEKPFVARVARVSEDFSSLSSVSML